MYFGRHNWQYMRSTPGSISIKKSEFSIDKFQDLKISNDAIYEIDIKEVGMTEFKGTHSIDFEVFTNGIALLHIAAIWNALDEFIYLHKISKLDINVGDRNSHTPLHYAISQGSTEVVAYIISQMNSQEFKQAIVNHTLCLNLAARTSSWRIIEILCEKGIDISKDGLEAIKIATTLTDIDTLRVLLSHCGANSRATSSPVDSAITFDKLDCLKMLFANGFEADKVEMDSIPLFKALDQYSVNSGIVQLILRYSQRYDIETPKRRSTVHYICKCMDPKIAADILVHDIDVNKLDEAGQPGPYYLCSKKGGDPVAILDMLYKKGYNVNIKFGSPAISVLNHFLTIFGDWEKIVRWYVEHGADLDEELANSRGKKVRDAIKKYYPKINLNDYE